MPKTKRLKYERVQHLPNVTLIEDNDGRSYRCFAWSDNRWEGMKKVLELGCGKGEHSLAFAAADPGKYCLGIDLKSHRICSGAEKAIALGLTNVHFLRARIEQIGDYSMRIFSRKFGSHFRIPTRKIEPPSFDCQERHS
jgi:tRNA (guanine-N7-)-methyltransferase